jgi:hypothetical protein
VKANKKGAVSNAKVLLFFNPNLVHFVPRVHYWRMQASSMSLLTKASA